jgi:hypothetical protein
VANLYGAFQSASAFNQNVLGWSTAAVTNMANMLNGATGFNTNIFRSASYAYRELRSIFS